MSSHQQESNEFSLEGSISQEMIQILQGFYDNFGTGSNYLLIGMYVPVIFLALISNLVVIIVVHKYQYLRSVTNYFVVNLCIADLLVTIICMPMAVSQAISVVWIYGELMCKLFFYLQGVAVASSVFTITLMSVDRYFAIKNPLVFKRLLNRKRTIIVIIVLWIIALSIFTPVLQAVTIKNPAKDLENITIIGGENNTKVHKLKIRNFYVCSEDFNALSLNANVFGSACFIIVYAIPGHIMIIAYSLMGRTLCSRKPPFDSDSAESSVSTQQGLKLHRERKRVAWILLLVAILFALCWLPYNILRLLVDFKIFHEDQFISDIMAYCLFLGHANSALNPMVYCLMTRNFRRSILDLLCRSIYHKVRSNTRDENSRSSINLRHSRSISRYQINLNHERNEVQQVPNAISSRPRLYASESINSNTSEDLAAKFCYR